jgi:hypothetical protein
MDKCQTEGLGKEDAELLDPPERRGIGYLPI